MAYRKLSGIYEIVNSANGKRYVGSAANMKQRWASHRHLLDAGRHHSVHLQRAWKKHGPGGFVFRALELGVLVEDLILREQHHINALKPEYNIARHAGSALGVRHTAETKAKIGEASRRAWQDEKVRGRLMVARRQAWDDPERREKGRAAMRRNWENPEYREKLMAARAKQAQALPPGFGDAVKQGIAARKAKGLPFARQINPCVGRRLSDATKEKLRQANLGKRHSDEARRKMSATRQGKKTGPRKARSSADD